MEFNKSDERYQEFLNVENAVIFMLNREQSFVSLNSGWKSLLDYTDEEIIGNSIFHFVDDGYHDLLRGQFKSLIEHDKDAIAKEIRLVTKKGQMEDVHLFLRADFDNNQELVSFSGTITDLTSRRPNIDAFKENESNYRFISEHMSDMVAVLAKDGLVLYASPSHTTVLGMDLDDYIGSYPIKHIHPDDWEKVFHFFHDMVAKWKTLDIDYRCMHQNGDWLYVEMKATPIKGPDGEIRVISVSRDITARKEAEENSRQATIKLKTLISSLPYGVLVEDEHGETTLYNDALLNIVKLIAVKDKNEIDDKDLMSWLNHSTLEVDKYLAEKEKITTNRETRQAEEIRLLDGRILERDAVPIEEDGRFDGYLWIFRDVTADKLAGQRLHEANQVLQRLSMIDGLTMIANRRCFDEKLDTEWDRLTGLSEPISLLLIDIDFFKAYNDQYGHQAGDACLQLMGNLLTNLSWGTNDLVARYGGEEFVVLLPERTLNQALEIGKMIQAAVMRSQLPHKGSNIGGFLTLSIGISTKSVTEFDQPTTLITEADKALYEAKRNGRNQMRVYNQG